MRIGIHTRKGGSFEGAALRALELGANALQLFSSSPRMWRASTPDPADVANLRRVRETHDLAPLVVHDSYLINLASCDPPVRQSSIAAFRGEIDRAITIGAEYLVMHPGACKGQSVEQAIMNVVDGLADASAGRKSDHLLILLENTVGAGGQLGAKFQELEVIRRLAQERMEIEVGFCLDTCHCFASGNYNVATEDGLRETLRAAGIVLGLDRVRVIHANDSKGAAGSRLDRHEHIGRGKIGAEGFARILRHPKLRKKAFILETPVDAPGEDKANLDTLKALANGLYRPH